ncbi:hypothetical protein ACWKWU_19375 [Chitinophaga lutea]
MVRYFLIWLLLLCAQTAAAQSNCFARAELDRRTVYPQQPFRVTVTVMTTTWFTAPLEFGALQLRDAMIVPFTNSTPGQFEYNGKYYPGVQFYYVVFPMKPGRAQVPSIAITASSPPEGSSESRKVTVYTAAQSYNVLPVPKAYPDGEPWMVAKDVSLADQWSGLKDSLKVGDVITRNVTVDAQGTLPQLIPAMDLAKEDWAGVYPQQPALRDLRTDNDVNGERRESGTYLLLKAGEFTLPASTVYWWDPFAQRLFKHTAPARKIKVYPNPDLGMLATIQDSLAATAAPAAVHKGPKQIAGQPWYLALLYGAGALLAAWLLFRWCRSLLRLLRKKYAAYKISEPVWFRRFLRAAPGTAPFLPRLYQWWDRFSFPGKKPYVGSDEIKTYYGSNGKDIASGGRLRSRLQALRKEARRNTSPDENLPEEQRPWGL